MTLATLDANALAAGAAGFHLAPSTPSALLRAWREGRFTLILSQHLLDEVTRTLGNAYFYSRLGATEIGSFLDALSSDAVIVPLTVTVQGVASHPEDDMVLATALSGQADYLVTGDRQLLRLGSYEGLIILTPRDFLTTLGGL